MLLLTSASDIIQVNTASSTAIKVHASYMDNASGTITPARTNTASITGTGNNTVVAAPAGGAQRNVKYLSVRNDHATLSNVVIVQHFDGTTTTPLWSGTLLAGEEAVLDDRGTWTYYDATGAVKPGAQYAFATQTQMEAAASTTTLVSPATMQYHPGVAKAVMFTTGTATPVAQTPPTYNCTLTDTGVGQLTVTMTIPFSSATAYCVQVNCEIISTTLTAAANCLNAYMRFGGMTAANSFQVNCCDRTATTNVIRDPISWHVLVHGDQ